MSMSLLTALPSENRSHSIFPIFRPILLHRLRLPFVISVSRQYPYPQHRRPAGDRRQPGGEGGGLAAHRTRLVRRRRYYDCLLRTRSVRRREEWRTHGRGDVGEGTWSVDAGRGLGVDAGVDVEEGRGRGSGRGLSVDGTGVEGVDSGSHREDLTNRVSRRELMRPHCGSW